MQLTGTGIRSRRAISFIASLLASVALMSGMCQELIGVNFAQIAVAQDRLKLGKESDSDSAVAESTDPVLIVSIASLNKLMQDINYITAIVGQPQAGGMFTMMAGGFAQGLDVSRPIGVIVPVVDGAFEPIGMIPTADAATMLKRLEGQIGPVDKLDDGTMVVAVGPSLVYIRQEGDWALVARQKELLDVISDDPAVLLEDLGDNYTLSARLYVQEVPEAMRDGLIAQLRQGFEQAMAKQGQGEGVQQASENSIKQIEQLIRESEELMVGWNINPEEKNVTVESEFIAADGTELAEVYAGQTAMASKFASVINDANAMFYHTAATIAPKVIERTRESIDNVKTMVKKAIDDSNDMDDHAKTQVNELAVSFINVLMKTIEEGKVDIGSKIEADDEQVNFSSGMLVSDGTEVATLVKDLAGKLKNEPKSPTFKFDEETYKGVSLHSVIIDIPANAEEARQIFGEQAIVKIGTAAKAVYFAMGTNSGKSIKKFIDGPAESSVPDDRPLGQMQVQLLPFLLFAQTVKPNDVVASMVDILSQDNETDYVLIEVEPVENGQSSILEIGEGLVKAIGAGVREGQAQQMKAMQQQGNGQF